ncbi:hypothetical protein [uncultured Methanolobus sp.]|uniref:hypothetical protein n=1 Tax=uncultured Methanolobus sp. TaxID=218300 RepID=UPI0029C8F4CA|nr:hypothetical protein [uncultured Methanolobus sp.]
MEEKLPENKKTDHLGKLDEIIKNPKYSIAFIFGIPLIFALGMALFDPNFLFFFLFGPPIVVACYAYYTGNESSSALTGLLFFPLIFFYLDVLEAISQPQFDRLIKYLEWPYIFRDFEYFWKIWISSSIASFLVANRKPIYLVIAVITFVSMFLEFIRFID